jgi:hypothetical protein
MTQDASALATTFAADLTQVFHKLRAHAFSVSRL